jgi:hypothetical protein
MMKEWFKKTSIVDVVIIPVLAWICYQLYEMHPKVDETAHRVDRIVEVLPEVKAHIVLEDMKKLVKLALVTKEPQQGLTGQWFQELDVIDFASGKKVTFGVPVKGQDESSASYLIYGMAGRISREKISFAEYTAATAEIGKPASYPPFVDAWSSFAIILKFSQYFIGSLAFASPDEFPTPRKIQQNFLRRLNRVCSPGRIRQRDRPLNVIGLELNETFGDFLHQFHSRFNDCCGGRLALVRIAIQIMR